MGMDPIGDFINKQEWLEPVEKTLGATADTLFGRLMPFSQKVRNFLHGVWLGHPLHPAITDVPVGAWTIAAVLDTYELATGDETFAPGADVAVGVGLLGAVGAAVTGLNDWNSIYEKPRRVGAVHAIVNISATACYAFSWYQRRHGRRRAGLTSALTGYALSAVGAWLGGHLVFHERIGVNHAPGELPTTFTPVMPVTDLPENKLFKAEVKGIPIILVRRGTRISVLAEKCSHLGGPLAEGKLEDDTVVCPWHYSRFSLRNGSVIDGPATYVQPCFEVRVRNGQIEVRTPRGVTPEPY
jgi:nitrite reductase/ring-hydroxylating ferredoxin subunit/uncharacterized membrane protein